MTLPDERTRAVLAMAEAVIALGPYMHGNSDGVRVQRELLRRLHTCLRHYPTPLDMQNAAEHAPMVFGSAPKAGTDGPKLGT